MTPDDVWAEVSRRVEATGAVFDGHSLTDLPPHTLTLMRQAAVFGYQVGRERAEREMADRLASAAVRCG